MAYIYFNVQQVYDYLTRHGYVYTVRRYPAEHYPHPRPVKVHNKLTGETVSTMTGSKLSEDMHELQPHVESSGFSSVQEWVKAM